MKLNTLFTINAVIALFFGLSSVLAPEKLYSFYGAPIHEAGLYAAQLAGAAYLGFAFLTFFARKAAKSPARTAIVIGLFVHFCAAFILSLKGQIAGLMNVYGWSNVALFLLLALGYGYFWLKKGAD